MENFLLDYDENSCEVLVQLTDFGLAKYYTDAKSLREEAGTLVGMAPEVVNGKQATFKVDCWALGVILYELLAESLPFESDNEYVLRFMICNYHLDFKTDSALSHASRECIDLLQRLLAKNPESRISSLDALNHPWLN